MRRLFLFGAVAFIISACTPKQPDPAITFPDGKTPELSFSSTASKGTVSFNSSLSWEASCDKDWVSLSLTKGDAGDCQIQVSATENTAMTERSAVLKITSGSIIKEVNIKQAAKSAVDIADKTFEISHTGGKFKVGVGHNVELSVSISAQGNWISQESVKSYSIDSLVFNVKANDSFDERTGTININSKDGKIKNVIAVKQEGVPAKESTIKELASSATTTETKFKVILKDAVVSYLIDGFCHIEDASGAILYTNSNGEEAMKSLNTGCVINGEVSGRIKLNGKMPEISSIDISLAGITTTSSIPVADITLAELSANYDKYLGRRVLLKAVTITRGTSAGTVANRSGNIKQDATEMTIYAAYTKNVAVLDAGLNGDLTCFPAYSGTTKKISVYKTDDFEETSQPAEENAFTKLTVLGVYNISNISSPSAIYTVAETDQKCSMSYSASTIFNMYSMSAGYGIFLTFGSAKLTNGRVTTAHVSKLGSGAVSGVSTGDFSVVVAKKDKKMVWVRTADSTTGFIINIE